MFTLCAVRTNPSAGSEKRIEPLQIAWDKAFRVKFHEFRERLRYISRQNRSYMRPLFDDVVKHPSSQLSKIMKCPGTIIFPTDDDDWFSADAIEKVLDHQPKCLARWNYTELMLGGVIRNLIAGEDWGFFYRYQCNNYAIVTPQQNGILESHFPDMSGNNPEHEVSIKLNLSVHNKTPASISHTRKLNTPDELNLQVESYLKNAESLFLPEFSKEIDMLLDLLKKTKTAKIHL